MGNEAWAFEEHPQKAVRRDPFEAEFFTGEEDTEEVYGRTDALVRWMLRGRREADQLQ